MIQDQAIRSAADMVAELRTPLADTLAAATARLAETGTDAPQALSRVAALLIGEVARALAGAADQGRAADARTFEAMFDVNAASGHFQGALEQGLRHAAAEIGADGYEKASAMVLAASRALDSVADIISGR